MSQISNRSAAMLLVASLVLLGFAEASAAQQAPLRVRGTLTQVKGDDVTVKAADGKVYKIALAPDARITLVLPAKLSTIKPGRFVGTAARPDGDKLKALEVHIFPPGARLGEGHRPWAPDPSASMTNADVTAAIVHAKTAEITLTTGGQNYVVEVPPGVPVVAYSDGTRKLLVKGAYVYFTQVDQDAAGGYSAKSINVSRDRRYPPK